MISEEKTRWTLQQPPPVQPDPPSPSFYTLFHVCLSINKTSPLETGRKKIRISFLWVKMSNVTLAEAAVTYQLHFVGHTFRKPTRLQDA